MSKRNTHTHTHTHTHKRLTGLATIFTSTTLGVCGCASESSTLTDTNITQTNDVIRLDSIITTTNLGDIYWGEDITPTVQDLNSLIRIKNYDPSKENEWFPNQWQITDIKVETGGNGSATISVVDWSPNYDKQEGNVVNINWKQHNETTRIALSSIITNAQITTDADPFSSQPDKITFLRKVKDIYSGLNLNQVDVDMSSTEWDKEHQIVGDESHYGSWKVTITPIPNSNLYEGSVDVYYLVTRIDLPVTTNTVATPSMCTPENTLIQFLSLNNIDGDKIVDGKYTITGSNTSYTLTITANPHYFDTQQAITLSINPGDETTYFTVSYSDLPSEYGWSGFTAGSIRFYKIDSVNHYVSMIDENIAVSKGNATPPSISGTNVVFGDKVRDSANVEWTVTQTVGQIGEGDNGAFGKSGSNTNPTFVGSVTINPSLTTISRNCFRRQTAMTELIIPDNSKLELIGACSLMGSSISYVNLPESCGIVEYGMVGSYGGDGATHIQSLTFNQTFMIPLRNAAGYEIIWDRIAPASVFTNGTGNGRIYVKNEKLRQEYINDPDWKGFLKPAGAIANMILVKP